MVASGLLTTAPVSPASRRVIQTIKPAIGIVYWYWYCIGIGDPNHQAGQLPTNTQHSGEKAPLTFNSTTVTEAQLFLATFANLMETK